MKQNDWLLAGLANPEFSTSEFLISGLNTDNTQFLTADQYKKSSFVRDRFSENGAFNEAAFDTYYKQRAQEFGKLQSLDTKDTFIYGPFDTRRKDNSLTRDPKFNIEVVANPERQTTMFTGATYDNEMSWRERAQQNKIWDTAKGEWSDETLNDRTLVNSPLKWFKSLFEDPIVYATYDEDGEHYDQFTGQMVKHSKGQYKINQYGLPYTETLNGRSLVGKEVVSAFDTLTVDGEGINKYDFFDSDGLDKSITGTVMKSVAAVAPMLMGPYVAPIYSGILVGRELMKTLPMLYGVTTAWFDMPADNKTLNTLAGYGERFTTSTSDYAKSKALTFETLNTLMTDVALQWGQQKAIANAITKLRGSKSLMEDAYKKAGMYYSMQSALLTAQAEKGIITKEALERYIGDPKKWQDSAIGKAAIAKFTKEVEPIVQRANRLGADASLAYMALVSNTDVYQSMLEHGASKQDAAAVALGSTIGMFSVDRFLGLGELFFDDLTANYERQIRNTFKNEAASWYNNVIRGTVAEAKTGSTSRIKSLIDSGILFGKKKASQFAEDVKYHSTGFFGKSIGEGLEEVSEELVTDLTKGIYELAGLLGADTSTKNVGAFDDWATRYGMSFLGGALGGGLFYGVNVYQNGKFHVDLTQDELIYLVRNGKTDEALKTLEDWRKKGKLGSTTLSTQTTTDENGNQVFLTADSEQDSQNEFIYKRIKETILSLENIINENRADLNEDQLFEKMIFSEARFKELSKYLDLQKLSYTTGYQRDYQRVLSNVIDLEGNLKRAMQTKTGIAYSNEEEFQLNIASDEQLRLLTEEEKAIRRNNLQQIQEQLGLAKTELQRFLTGEYSIGYTEKMLFALDSHLNEDFVAMTFEQWLKKNHDGKTTATLSPSEQVQYKEEYLNYKKSAQEEDLNQKFEIYKRIKEQMNPVLLNIQQNQEAFKKFQEEIAKLKSEDSPLFNIKQYSVDDILDFAGETKDSESYTNRDNPETRAEREELVAQENLRQTEALKNQILAIIEQAGGFIDPVTRRDLKLLLNVRNKDVLEPIKHNVAIDMARNNTVIDDETGNVIQAGMLSELDKSVLQVLSTIDANNLEDSNKAWDEIAKLVQEDFVAPILERNRTLAKLTAYLGETGFDYFSEDGSIYGSDLKAIIEQQIANGRTVDEIFDLNNTELYSNDYESGYGLTAPELAAFLQNIKARYEQGTLDDYEYNEQNIQSVIKNDSNLHEELNYYNQIFQDYIQKIKSNPVINLNKELDEKVSDINPVIDLVKSLGLSLNVNMDNLEKILQDLDSRFEETDDLHDLVLTAEEKESFDEAAYILKLAKSYLYAASATPTILAPFGHNAALNEFAEHHKDVYKDYEALPVLDVDIAAMYENELNKYLMQMGVKDETTGQYNAGSWSWLSAQNEINKAQQFIRADKAWSQTTYDFFANNAGSFKFTYDGVDYDLLKGFETIPQVTKDTKDSLVHLNKMYDLFYRNVKELMDKGWTYKQILERSKILDNIAVLDNVTKQKTTSLDENVSYDRMTDYDKMVFLTTIAAMDSTKFYSYLQDRVNEEDGIAPLTIQEWVSRVGIAQLENPGVFNDTLEYIKSKTNSPLPIIYNAVYIGGNAGAGKSRVVGRNIAKYVKSNNIWLSAPKESQINTLFESTSKGVKYLNRRTAEDKEDKYPILMESIGVDKKAYDAAMAAIRSNKTESTPYFTAKETDNAYVLTIIPEKFGIKKIDNAPEAIIIDEVTHLSNLELQLLGEFARLNGTKLVLLGDNKQMGFNNLGRNIDREQALVIRTPNLGISLRDNNIQHQFNLNTVEALINQLSDADVDNIPAYNAQVNAVKSLLKNVKFKVYHQDDIHGDLVTNELTQQFAQHMANGEVGYVGRPQSHTLDVLRNAGIEPTILKELDVQGQEFDYIVVDKDWTIPTPQSSDVQLLNFLQDLYTMISRGRKGSVIIDPSGQLAATIGENRVEFAKAEAVSILEYAGDFRRQKIDLLNKVLGNKTAEPAPAKPAENPVVEEGEEPSKIVLDKDFNIDDLDFDNNYYVIHQTGFANVNSILEGGLNTGAGLNGTALWGTRDTIAQTIENQRNGHGHEGSDSIIIMEFPKATFNPDGKRITLDDISIKIADDGGSVSVVPAKYIKSVIHTIPTESGESFKTDGSEISPDLEVTEGEKEELLGDNPTDAEDIIDQPSNPMLCYGGATLTGLKVEMRDGKQVWINPKDAVKRDAQLFTSLDEISDDLQQQDISNKLRGFKNAFLYRTAYEKLPKYITDLISKEQYEGMDWYIEARPQNDQDNFIRNTAFTEIKPISSKNLVFSIVGQFTLKDGSIGTITLGLMGDPKNWINQVPTIKKRLDAKIKKLKDKIANTVGITKALREGLESRIARYEEQKKKLNLDDTQSDPRRYDSYIEKLAGRFDGTNPVRVKIPRIITPGLTDLHRQSGVVRMSRMSKSLVRNAEQMRAKLVEALNSSRVKGNSILKAKILREIESVDRKLEEFRKMKDSSFRSLNPYMTVSPMYIYTPNSAARGTSDIDDSVIGKCCVVFVTNQEGLSPDELVDIYISQKNQTEQERKKNGTVDLTNSEVVPSVRMVVLNNLGVSFQDMSNPYLAESMTSKVSFTTSKGKSLSHSQIYPFKTNMMGIRMYVGLWNFRANLLQFLKQFNKFASSLPINPADLDIYLTAKDLKWRKENGRVLAAEEQDFLDKHTTLANFDEVSRLVDEFNDSLGDKVKQFRLGSSLANGAYIRQLTGNTQVLYAVKDQVNGIYLNSETLNKYLGIASSLFDDILGHIVTCDLEPDRLLSTKQGVKNSFANHLTSIANTNGTIEIIDTQTGEKQDVNFGSSYDPTGSKGILNTFSHIPAVLSKVFKFTSIRQRHLTSNTFDLEDDYSIRIKGTVQDESGADVQIDKKIPYQRLWKYVDMIEAADEYDQSAIDGYVFDKTLSNFFSFAFHGTLEDVQDRSHHRASDALFPYGFFADPLSTTELVMSGGNKMFTKAVQQQIFFGSDVRVGDPTFFVSMDAMQQAVNDVPTPQGDTDTTEKCVELISKMTEAYPQLAEEFAAIAEGLSELSDEQKLIYVLNSIAEELEKVTANGFNTVFSGVIKTIDKTTLVKQVSDTEAITLEQLIASQYNTDFNEELPSIDSITVDGKSLIVDAGEISLKVSRDLAGGITISKLTAEPVQDSQVVGAVNAMLKALDGILKKNQIDDIRSALETYSKISEDMKLAQKDVLIKKLKRLSLSLGTNRNAYKQVKDTLSKIQEPNCI